MKNSLKNTLIFVCSMFFSLLFTFLGIKWDIFINPWLKDVSHYQWYNYFTTHHALTIMYLNGSYAFGPLAIILSIVFALVVVSISQEKKI